MNKLSVVLATFNEENNLKACLDSVKELADEIVIVDGGSKDKTVEIAESFGAKVIETSNPQIFHINKNKAIDAATCDWILQLDADEVVSPALLSEIKKVISDKESLDGYWIPRSNFFLGHFLRKGGQYPDYTLRLYKKGKGRLPAKDVHEQAVIDGQVGYLKNDLLHYRDLTLSKYLSGLDRYTTLIAVQMKEKNENILLSFFGYMILKPIWWFLKTYFRHKGFVDGWQGFTFSFFSSLRFPIAYIKFIKGDSD
jgi:glycosyltransferase involved in cell wall biosynthesis